MRAAVLGVLLVVGVLCFGVALSRDINRLHAAASWPVRPSGSGPIASGDVSAIASAVNPTLVDINVTLAYEAAQAAGTGIVLSSSGLVLTNNHVVNGATSLAVTDVGNGQTYQATVLGYDRSHDIALIQLNGASGLATAQLGDSSKVTVGQSVVAIGNAGGAGGTPSAAGGALIALGRQIVASDEFDGTSEQLDDLIETNAAIQPGDSGGPLVNLAGQVIGIDTATSEGYSFSSAGNEGFAVPVNTAMAIATQIENHQSSATVHIGPTAFVGVELAGGSGSSGSGATVTGVLPGSPAEQVGLAPGDRIVAFDDQTVDSPQTLSTLLGRHHPGDHVPIGWTDPAGTQHTGMLQLVAGPAA